MVEWPNYVLQMFINACVVGRKGKFALVVWYQRRFTWDSSLIIFYSQFFSNFYWFSWHWNCIKNEKKFIAQTLPESGHLISQWAWASKLTWLVTRTGLGPYKNNGLWTQELCKSDPNPTHVHPYSNDGYF